MAKKQRKIVQCPFCDSNRLYFRRGLVSDVLISLLVPVRSFTCGSCSRSFRRYGNYFTSKQALLHIACILLIAAMVNPSLFIPQNWLLKEQKAEMPVPTIQKVSEAETIPSPDEIPLPNFALVNSTNSTATSNATATNSSSHTILAFNGTEVVNSTAELKTTPYVQNKTGVPEKKEKQGLQGGKLKSIYFKAVNGITRIDLDLGGAPLSYTSFFLNEPDRMVVDIHGNWDYFGPTTLKPENPIFSSFRIGTYEDKIRMVMDLKTQASTPLISKTDDGLHIDIK